MGCYSALFTALLVTTTSALRCNVGSITFDKYGVSVHAFFHEKECTGVCTTKIIDLPDQSSIAVLTCEESFRFRKTSISGDVCTADLCNSIAGIQSVAIAAANSSMCYVGLQQGAYSIGGTELCDGSCATFTTDINGVASNLYFCAPRALCASILKDKPDPQNDCGIFDGKVNACCCNTENDCNAKGKVTPIPPLPTNDRIPIACYAGIHLEGKALSGGEYVACQGDCASLQYTTVSNLSLTVYGCDPATVCRGFNLRNGCAKVDAYYGCCCDTDDCIDPTRNPPISPDQPVSEFIECYVGLHISDPANHTFDKGAQNYCQGQCASTSTLIGSAAVDVFFCAEKELCTSLDVQNSCTAVKVGDQDLLTCCCNDKPNCNTRGLIPSQAPATVKPTQMIACYEGLVVNNITLSGRFTACDGDCASVTLPTSLNGMPSEVTILSCDPAAVCQGLGVVNDCKKIAGIISGCCCDSDVCINPISHKYPSANTTAQSLMCFVGISTGNTVIGGQMPCDGECGRFASFVSNAQAEGYFCAPKTLCSVLGAHNGCATLFTSDGSVSGCCCDTADNCNYDQAAPIPPYTPSTKPPMACYSGLKLDGMHLQDADRFMTCRGSCGSVTFTTAINGNNHSATIFSCDPVNVCDSLGLKDSCNTLNASDVSSISGCCCSWNDCLDLNSGGIKPSIDNLQCFIGYSLEGNNGNLTLGTATPCSGQCGSVETQINGVNAFAFFCASNRACNSLNMTNTCATIFSDNADFVTGCCCSDAQNCNINNAKVGPPVPPATSLPDVSAPLACYSGVSINSNLLTSIDSYTTCHGYCGSLSYHTLLNGKSYTTTIYECDPVSLCNTLGLANSCGSLKSENSSTTVYGCCCDWNDCIDTSNNGMIKPSNHTHRPESLECLVGYSLDFGGAAGTFFKGGTLPCTGSCAIAETSIAEVITSVYFCAPESLCTALNIHDECQTILNDFNVFIKGCCCDTSSNCNNYNNATIPPYTPPDKSPIACYSGLSINGKFYSDANSYMSCQGDCGLFTFNANTGAGWVNTTVYTCDPVSVCDSLKLKDSCTQLNSTLSGCCCSWNDCLDITNKQVKPSEDSLGCFVGLATEGTQSSVYGSVQPCKGQCVSIQTKVSATSTFGFFCSNDALCNTVGMRNNCSTIFNSGGEFITGCCCNDANGCNLQNAGFTAPTALPPAPTGMSPITCYNGLSVNGKLLSSSTAYSACYGQCTSITYSSTISGATFDSTIFSCDPISFCDHFNIGNTCGVILNGITNIQGCCCSTDDCLDLNTGKIKPQKKQKCFVGVATEGGDSQTTFGLTQDCEGQCGTLQSKINNYNTFGFFCASNNLCNSLNMTNHCDTFFTDNAEFVQACCCNDGDDCNLYHANVQPATTIAPPPHKGSPISCYNGLAINGLLLTPGDSFTTCFGECASLSYHSVFNGQSVLTTVLTCDPATVCDTFGMSNNCNVIQNGNTSTTLYGCCCNWNDCLDFTGQIKSTNNTHRPDNLECLVGYSIDFGGVNGLKFNGASMPCTGTCASAETTIGSLITTGYFCAPTTLCTSLDISNSCATLLGQQYVKGCCCDSAQNCNNYHDVLVPPYTPSNKSPIACYSGLSINGKFFSDPNSYMSCRGDCGLFTFSANSGNNSWVNTTVYACDPVSVCDSVGIKDNCNKMGDHLSGCCCSWNDCLDITNKQVKPRPIDHLPCFVGLSVDSTSSSTYGLSQQCTGHCGSVQTRINGQTTFGFFCASDALCNSLNSSNSCTTIFTGTDFITTCCCNDEDDCNIRNANIAEPTANATIAPPPHVGTPITCFNGITVNGTYLSANDSYSVCYGECSSINYQSQIGGSIFATSIFTCDPASFCDKFGISNSCSQIQSSANTTTRLSACCCSSSGCLDTNGNIIVTAAPPTVTSQSLMTSPILALLFATVLLIFKL